MCPARWPCAIHQEQSSSSFEINETEKKIQQTHGVGGNGMGKNGSQKDYSEKVVHTKLRYIHFLFLEVLKSESGTSVSYSASYVSVFFLYFIFGVCAVWRGWGSRNNCIYRGGRTSQKKESERGRTLIIVIKIRRDVNFDPCGYFGCFFYISCLPSLLSDFRWITSVLSRRIFMQIELNWRTKKGINISNRIDAQYRIQQTNSVQLNWYLCGCEQCALCICISNESFCMEERETKTNSRLCVCSFICWRDAAVDIIHLPSENEWKRFLYGIWNVISPFLLPTPAPSPLYLSVFHILQCDRRSYQCGRDGMPTTHTQTHS